MVLGTVLLYGGEVPVAVWHALEPSLLITIALLVASNFLAGLYNRIWEYATAETAVAIGIGVTAAVAGGMVVSRAVNLPDSLPIAVWYVTWLTCLVTIGGIRFAWRMLRPRLGKAGAPAAKRILIYGAGEQGSLLTRALTHMNDNSYHVVGYVDDDPDKMGVIIGKVRVLGNGHDVPHLVARHRVDEVIITVPSATREKIREIYQVCTEAGVKAKALPSFLEIMEGASLAPREVSVEDLLGRELSLSSIKLHEDYIAGKTVLVTGAGGSIGSELCRQICRYGPRRLLLLGRGENRIHWAYLHLKQRYPDVEFVTIIQNITVESGMRRVFATYRPDLVFHTAAHKHVYLMERAPVEAVRNNVIGTRILARLAEEYGVERFTAISTDKAVAPTAVMGATKRVGELLLTTRPYLGTRFICVRFGNVLGSEGSVLEIFKRQRQRGEPLTVTDPQATRYFMSIPEACFLVLQSGAIGTHGNIFLLDMGEAISILKLAQDFILMHGGNPHEEGAIKITGLRHGEKMHETLTYSQEELLPTADEHILQVAGGCPQESIEHLRDQIAGLERCVENEDEEGVCAILNAITGSCVTPDRLGVASV